jgi:hypothetical protein
MAQRATGGNDDFDRSFQSRSGAARASSQRRALAEGSGGFSKEGFSTGSKMPTGPLTTLDESAYIC